MFRKKKGRQHNDLSENHRMIDNLCTTNLLIPPSDLFEVVDPPDMCPNYESCLDLVTEGTYIAVIKRKEVTRLDPKYMISMAEARGLFGRPDGTPKTKQSGQTARAKAALAALQAKTDAMAEKSKTKVKVEMDRIAAPTRASLLRDVKPVESKDCPRHTTHQAHDGTPSVGHTPRIWWQELSVYLLTMLGNPDIPLPPLRLTRRKHKPIAIKVKRPRDTFPLHVNSIEFKSDTEDFVSYLSLPSTTVNTGTPSVASGPTNGIVISTYH